ncbi:MAG TPA: fumarylacetoacetate hydrolase family protein [Vicinamibacterales bacterium]|nr:fumarylacetoacetate hydrolase family protein [Vicinamibacterales bacterium]
MRLARFDDNRLGLVDGDCVRDVTPALEVLPSVHYPVPPGDLLIANLDRVCERARALADASPALPLSSVALRSPVANPGKVVAAPVNYQRHLEEVRGDAALHHDNAINTIHRAGLFLKASSSVVGASDGIALEMLDRRSDHEVELAVVIGRRARRVTRAEALHCVAGYCIGLDITIRGSEERSLRKSVDTYTVLGPYLVTAGEVGSPDDLELGLSVNGERRQSSNTRFLIKKVAELVEFASSFYTLYPGDVLMTGTPEGVAPIYPGDTIEATISRIGTMRVNVRAA